MQAWQVLTVALVLLLELVVQTSGAAYYKVRPPPSNHPHPHPHPHPHYGHPHYYSKTGPHPPPPHRRPIPIHAPRNPIRPPPRPFINKPSPPSPPHLAPASWKTPHSTFHAPVVKETFHSSPLSYTPDITHSYVRDDDKGPIHTIPAPNLSAADRPSQEYTQGHTNPGLEAVLRHGEEAAHNKAVSVYQVTEDPSVYKPYSGGLSYFAPDPDPSLPTIEVPKTLDPHSIPSNGQQPLDLYQQQLEEGHQPDQTVVAVPVQQSYTDGGNTLSPQELYSLLHGGQGAGVGVGAGDQMTPELYQQYLQAAAAQQVYNAGLLYQQQQQAAQFSQQSFNPQFETFNYNEQTQEGAYGSDSFPSSSSISVGVKRAVSKDTALPGGNLLEKVQAEDSSEVGVISNQVDYEDEQSSEENKEGNKPANILNTAYYASLPDKQTAETLATLAAAGNSNNQIMKSPNLNMGNNVKEINQDGKVLYQTSQGSNQNNNNDPSKNKIVSDLQRLNEIKSQQDQSQPTHINHELRNNQGNQMEHSVQLFVNHDMSNAHETNKNQRIQPFRNHIVGTREHDNDQQNPSNHNQRDQQKTLGHPQNKEESKHKVAEIDADYSEDEILDPSDKDLRNKGMNGQNSMNNIYSYYRNINDQREINESQTEEQSYEDADYSQEDEKRITINDSLSNIGETTEKTVNYNAHQNRLPFGAKLKPKQL